MSSVNQYELQIPDNQQEDEDDLNNTISFKESVVMNADWTIETIDNQIKKEILIFNQVFKDVVLGMISVKVD